MEWWASAWTALESAASFWGGVAVGHLANVLGTLPSDVARVLGLDIGDATQRENSHSDTRGAASSLLPPLLLLVGLALAVFAMLRAIARVPLRQRPTPPHHHPSAAHKAPKLRGKRVVDDGAARPQPREASQSQRQGSIKGDSRVACIFDLETTGLRRFDRDFARVDRIISIGAVIVRFEDSNVREVGTFHEYVSSPVPVKKRAYETHGISDDILQSAPPFREVWRRFCAFCEAEKASHLIGHNALQFDYPVIASHRYHHTEGLPFPRSVTHLIDTLVLAKQLKKGGAIDTPNLKLGTLYEAATGHPLFGAHDALNDCRAVLEVLRSPPFFDLFADIEAIAAGAREECRALDRKFQARQLEKFPPKLQPPRPPQG